MTRKMFLDDSYHDRFQAEIIDSHKSESGWEVILKETCFYPESGGQPADRGTIGSIPVTDVRLRGEEIVHILAGQPPSQSTTAVIDWPRRYDHMQQHTGQHLLTAAIIKLFNADTVGFHLGAETSTIDITLPGLSPERTTRAEELCGEWITAGLPVGIEYVSRERFLEMDLRKKTLPDDLTGDVRLVRIGDVDVAHCGGTHLKSTAELQLIKITGTERVRDLTRVAFLAGKRAIGDYSRKHNMLSDLAGMLTCGVADLQGRIQKMHEEAKVAARALNKSRKELIEAMVRSELDKVTVSGKYLVYTGRHDGWQTEELKKLAGGMTSEKQNLICCCASVEAGRGIVILAAGDLFEGDLGDVVQDLLPIFNGRGGGRGRFAQAVGDPQGINEVLSSAEQTLLKIGEGK